LKLLGGSFPVAMVLKASPALAAGKAQHVRIVEFDASGTRTGVVDCPLSRGAMSAIFVSQP